jgi:hypothetical protein
MKKEIKKRAREEENEEQCAADMITGISRIPERELKKSMDHIKKQRSAGKPATKEMIQLLKYDMEDLEAESESETDDCVADADQDYELHRRLTSKEEKKASRHAHDTAPTKEDLLYRDVNRPDQIIDTELGDFETIFCFACMRALQKDFEERFRSEPRTKEECELVGKWLVHNIKTPLDRLGAVVAKGEHSEQRVALFTQLKGSCSLEFEDLDPEDASTHVCAISNKELSYEDCTRVIMVDDPSLFRPYSKQAKEVYDDTPRIYFVHNQYRNLCYSVFHLRNLVNAIGVHCIRWAREKHVLYKWGASRIAVVYRDSDPKLLSTQLDNFKVCKATVEAYCRTRRSESK